MSGPPPTDPGGRPVRTGRDRGTIARMLALSAVMLAALAPATAAAGPGPWKPLLDELELPPERAQLAPGRWRGGGARALPVFERLWDDWFLLEEHAVSSGRRVLECASSFRGLVSAAGDRVAPGADLSASGAPAEQDEAEPARRLVDALAAVWRQGGEPLPDARSAELLEQARKVPRPGTTPTRARPASETPARRGSSTRAWGCSWTRAARIASPGTVRRTAARGSDRRNRTARTPAALAWRSERCRLTARAGGGLHGVSQMGTSLTA